MSASYPRPLLTVDIVVLSQLQGRLHLLLIQRREPPFEGLWALPGGYVEPTESLAQAAVRELKEETGVPVDAEKLLQIGAFADPERDPRGFTVSVAFVALVGLGVPLTAGDDAALAQWFPVQALPELAFDHRDIVARARERLIDSVQSSPFVLELFSRPFRSADARRLYAELLGKDIKPRAFKAWLRRREVVERVGKSRYQARPEMHPDWCR